MPDAAVPAGHVQSVSVVHEALRQNPPEQTSPLAQFAFDPQVPLQEFGSPGGLVGVAVGVGVAVLVGVAVGEPVGVGVGVEVAPNTKERALQDMGAS